MKPKQHKDWIVGAHARPVYPLYNETNHKLSKMATESSKISFNWVIERLGENWVFRPSTIHVKGTPHFYSQRPANIDDDIEITFVNFETVAKRRPGTLWKVCCNTHEQAEDLKRLMRRISSGETMTIGKPNERMTALVSQSYPVVKKILPGLDSKHQWFHFFSQWVKSNYDSLVRASERQPFVTG